VTPGLIDLMSTFRDVLFRAQRMKCNGAKRCVLLPGLFFFMPS